MKYFARLGIFILPLFLIACGGDNGDENTVEPSEVDMKTVIERTIPKNAGITVSNFTKKACSHRGDGIFYCTFGMSAERQDADTGAIERNSINESGLFWKEGKRWDGQRGSGAVNRSKKAANETVIEPDEAEMRAAIEASKPQDVDLKIIGFKKKSCKETQNHKFECPFVAELEGMHPSNNVRQHWTFEEVGIFKKVDGQWTSNTL